MKDIVAPRIVRVIAYLVFGGLGVAQGAVRVGYASVNAPTPAWLTVATAVILFVASAPFVLAVLNVPDKQKSVVPSTPVDQPEEPQ